VSAVTAAYRSGGEGSKILEEKKEEKKGTVPSVGEAALVGTIRSTTETTTKKLTLHISDGSSSSSHVDETLTSPFGEPLHFPLNASRDQVLVMMATYLQARRYKVPQTSPTKV